MKLKDFTDGKAIIPLIDPDKWSMRDDFTHLLQRLAKLSLKVVLVGSSQPLKTDFDQFIQTMREYLNCKIIIFPSSYKTISRYADGILYLSLLNSRDPNYLIGNHIKSAPIIKEYNLETFSTAYLLFGDRDSSVAKHSNTEPLSTNSLREIEPYILAAEYLGMEHIYLEAGSGAKESIPIEIVKLARSLTNLPIICGGGIKDKDTAQALFEAGSDFVIIGNLLEESGGFEKFEGVVGDITE